MPSSILNSDDGVISGTSGLKSSGGDDGVLVFQSKGTETARINTDKQIVAAAGTASLPALTTTGDVNTGIYFPAADNIAFTTGGTIRGRWTTDGLCFGSDTAAANALDDYEEGTWTPTIIGTSTAGTATYNVQGGVYTKIGRTVVFRLRVEISALSGATGNLAVGNLPFSCGTQTAVSIGFANNLALAGNNYATAFAGGTSIEIYQYPVGGGSGSAVAIDTAFDIMIAGVYQL